MASEEPALSKERKRKAVSALRDLADELGVPQSRRKADLSKADFEAAHAAHLES